MLYSLIPSSGHPVVAKVALVREHLAKAQQAQQRHYDRAAQPREFQTGDRMMVLVPTAACKFLTTWKGPYMVVEKIGPVTYRVRQPGRRNPEQLYHVNLLKKWVGTREQVIALATVEPVLVDVNPELSAVQKAELQHLIGQFSDLFSTVPGQTHHVSSMTLKRHQGSSSSNGPTGSQRLAGRLLRKKSNKC